jgi:hypothetical protein
VADLTIALSLATDRGTGQPVLDAARQPSRPASVARPAGLTEREVDVLRLIAALAAQGGSSTSETMARLVKGRASPFGADPRRAV